VVVVRFSFRERVGQYIISIELVPAPTGTALTDLNAASSAAEKAQAQTVFKPPYALARITWGEDYPPETQFQRSPPLPVTYYVFKAVVLPSTATVNATATATAAATATATAPPVTTNASSGASSSSSECLVLRDYDGTS
jgi:hypothetical protein